MMRIVKYVLLTAAVVSLSAACDSDRKKRDAAAGSAETESVAAPADGGVAPLSRSGGALLSTAPAEGEASAIALASASSRKSGSSMSGKIYVEKVESAKINGMTSAQLRVRVANTSRYDVTVDNASAVLFSGNSTVGSARCGNSITLPKRTSTSVDVPLTFSVNNILTAYSVLSKARRGDLSGLTVTVSATVSWNKKSADLKAERIPVEQILSQLGYTADDVKNKIGKIGL